MTGSTKVTVALITTTLATDPGQATLTVTATLDMATMDNRSLVNATVGTPTTIVEYAALLLLVKIFLHP